MSATTTPAATLAGGIRATIANAARSGATLSLADSGRVLSLTATPGQLVGLAGWGTLTYAAAVHAGEHMHRLVRDIAYFLRTADGSCKSLHTVARMDRPTDADRDALAALARAAGVPGGGGEQA